MATAQSEGLGLAMNVPSEPLGQGFVLKRFRAMCSFLKVLTNSKNK